VDYFLSENYDAIQRLLDEEKVAEYSKDDFTPELIQHVESDLNTLKEIEQYWENINYDPKLNSFIERIKSEKVLRENKLLIFTESKETAMYLSEKLKERLNEEVLLHHGDSSEYELKAVIENFDAKARIQKDDYRILVTTEVLAEGVNLHRANVVVNYDIPWNPTRMIQRVGRVNRVDTPFDEIFIYNFFPTDETNDIIKLKEAAIAKINYFIEMLGNDAKLLTDGEEIKSFELFKKLSSESFILGDEDAEESELKYLRVIEDIRDNHSELFAQIKKLPRKARVARKANAAFRGNEDALVTYFRKGKLEKFYLSTPAQTKELDFLTTAKLFEATQQTPSQKLPKEFYDLLKKNKAQLEKDVIDNEEPPNTIQRGGRDHASKIRKILNAKEIKRFPGFTEVEDDYLRRVRRLLDEGGMPKTIAKRIYAAIKEETDPRRILATIKRELSEQFLDFSRIPQNVLADVPGEVILSEYMIKQEEDEV